jgi:hypothetical protein
VSLTSRIKPLTSGGGHPLGFNISAWSPDGARIAYIKSYSNKDSGIYVMRADGTNKTRIITGTTIGTVYWGRLRFDSDIDDGYGQHVEDLGAQAEF